MCDQDRPFSSSKEQQSLCELVPKYILILRPRKVFRFTITEHVQTALISQPSQYQLHHLRLSGLSGRE